MDSLIFSLTSAAPCQHAMSVRHVLQVGTCIVHIYITYYIKNCVFRGVEKVREYIHIQ